MSPSATSFLADGNQHETQTRVSPLVDVKVMIGCERVQCAARVLTQTATYRAVPLPERHPSVHVWLYPDLP